jgi:O-antigen/teichoic acid export membrane protein
VNATLPVVAKSPERQRGATFGLVWSANTQIISAALKVLSTVVLTRLLVPDAYALLGTAMIAITTLEWLSDLGITPALVRHPLGDHRHVLLAGWWVNMFRSCAMAFVTFCLAFPLSWIYQKPELTAIISALSLRPLLLGFRSPGMPLLRRRLDYRSLFIDEITQTAVGAGVSILSAYLLGVQQGAWALVLGTLAGTITGVILSYILVSFQPAWAWDRLIAKQLAKFGSSVLVNTALMALWLNCDRLLAPAFVQLPELGYYVIAWNLASAAESLVTRCLDVYFGFLSRQNHEQRLARHHKIGLYLLVGGIALTVIAIIATPYVVNLLYDSRYAQVGFIFAVLVARLAVRATGQFDFQYLLVNGTLRWATIGYCVGALSQIALIVPLVTSFGVIGLAFSAFISTIAVSMTNCFSTGLGYRSALRVLLISIAAISGLFSGVTLFAK